MNEEGNSRVKCRENSGERDQLSEQVLGSLPLAPGGFLLDVAALAAARADRKGTESRKLPAGLSFPPDIKRSLTNVKHTQTFCPCLNGAVHPPFELQAHLS